MHKAIGALPGHDAADRLAKGSLEECEVKKKKGNGGEGSKKTKNTNGPNRQDSPEPSTFLLS